MNYQKIYDDIINKARSLNRVKTKENYFEKHHIIPRCMDGTDEKENLVLLNPREHYICHKILVKIYPSNIKLNHALHMICYTKTNINRKISAREYESIKISFILSITGEKNPFFNKKHSSETIEKIKLKRANQTFSLETRLKLSKAGKGRICTEETRQKKRENNLGDKNPMYGKLVSKETRNKLKDSNTGKVRSNDSKERYRIAQYNMPRGKCDHCGKEGTIARLKPFHFDNCKFKSEINILNNILTCENLLQKR